MPAEAQPNAPEAVEHVSWTRAWRSRFHDELIVAGFSRVEDAVGDSWSGEIDVQFVDPESGVRRNLRQRILVELPAAFPFAKPVVRPVGAENLRGTPHLMFAGGHTALCLWVDGRNGWRPWYGATRVLERIGTWYRKAYENDWTADEQPPDLHMYFSLSSGVRMAVTGEDWPPDTAGSSGRFRVWSRNDHAVLAGAPTLGMNIEPTSEPPARERLSFTSLRGRLSSGVGYWFRVNRSPRPVSNLAALLRELDDARGLAEGATLQQMRAAEGSKLPTGHELAFFALGYRDDQGDEHWLFLNANRSAHRRNWLTTQALEATEVFGLSAAPATKQALLRRTGHIARSLEGRKVVVFGVGAVGSSVAMWLAKAGVPSLTLVDSDRLRPGNVVRHVADTSLIGYDKAFATLFRIKLQVPDCEVRTHPETWDEKALEALAASNDVVLDATAVGAFSLLLNEICLRTRTPLVSVAAFHRAKIGRIRLVRPGVDACLMCHEGGYIPSDGSYPTIPKEDAGWFFESGCGTATVEASALDADGVGSVATRRLLGLLREAGSDRSESVGTDNLGFVVNEVEGDWPAPFDRAGFHWSSWGPRPGCDACGGARTLRVSAA